MPTDFAAFATAWKVATKPLRRRPLASHAPCRLGGRAGRGRRRARRAPTTGRRAGRSRRRAPRALCRAAAAAATSASSSERRTQEPNRHFTPRLAPSRPEQEFAAPHRAMAAASVLILVLSRERTSHHEHELAPPGRVRHHRLHRFRRSDTSALPAHHTTAAEADALGERVLADARAEAETPQLERVCRSHLRRPAKSAAP